MGTTILQTSQDRLRVSLRLLRLSVFVVMLVWMLDKWRFASEGGGSVG